MDVPLPLNESSNGEHKQPYITQRVNSNTNDSDKSFTTTVASAATTDGTSSPNDIIVSINNATRVAYNSGAVSMVPIAAVPVSSASSQSSGVLLERCLSEGCTYNCNVFVPPPNTPIQQYAMDHNVLCERCHHGAMDHRKMEVSETMINKRHSATVIV
jgi:hypothetical protein